MPARNCLKQFQPDHYYHVYNRGVARQPIFMEERDKLYFLKLLDRHLNPETHSLDKQNLPYKKFDNKVELLCYCLMKNHYHMLFYLGEDKRAITELMHSVGTAYTMYFNLKYDRVGPLFQGRFKASCITSDKYLLHVSRYIHLNPRGYKGYRFSSLASYLGKPHDVWLRPEKVLTLFEDGEYIKFMEDYEEYKASLDILKYELANM